MAGLPGGGGGLDLFTLMATLGLNTAPYQNAIRGATDMFNGLGDLIGRGLHLAIDVAWDFTKDVFETGMGFDKEMSAVQAMLGEAEGTAENMQRIREATLEAARDSIFTAEESAKADYYMALAGWNTEEIMSGLPGVIALAAASGDDLKTTSDIVTDALTAFGLGAGQATHFVDVLAATATNSNTDVAKMGQTFKYLAPIAGALGYSIEDMGLSVGLIANNGIKATMAGTSLRNIFTRIATNAGQTKKDLGALDVLVDELGVDFYTAEGRARPWGEVLADMREKWKQLDPKQVDKVTSAFGEFSAESQDASDIMAEFATDLDNWTTIWNSLKTDAERQNFVKELEPQFNTLGVSMRDSNGNLREFNQVAGDARVILGGLSDQEQIYYGKQIGSLRGISAVLALMTASEADVQQLKTAIEGADGAAKNMAATRLDNLWGDLMLFGSSYDVLKNTIFDDVKGPAREVIQEATRWIDDITKAIGKDGLVGGIEELARHITELGEDESFQELMRSIGTAVAPILSAVWDVIAATFPTAVQLGSEFGIGLIQGLTGETTDKKGLDGFLEVLNSGLNSVFEGAAEALWNKIDELSGGALSSIMNTIAHPVNALEQGFGGLVSSLIFGKNQPVFGKNETEQTPTVDVEPVTTLSKIQAMLDKAHEEGEATVTVDNIEFSSSLDAKTIYDTISAPMTDSMDTAVTNGFASATTNAEGMFAESADTMADSVETEIGNAGTPAASTFAENFQIELDKHRFTLSGNIDVSTMPYPVQHNARAMTGGRIFKRPTIFGYAEGSYQVAGDAGPEAVVGVNSLYGMISQAVDNTMGQRMEYTEPLTTPEPTYYESTQNSVERVTEYRDSTADSGISNILTAIYATVQKISSSFDAKAMASTATASMLSAIDNSIFSNTEATIFSADSAANIVRDELFSNTEATIYSAENAANLLRNEIYSNTEATILSGDSVASTISGTITTYADMMMATMAEILTAVRICASKNNNASMEMDGTTFARVFLPYLNREQQRLGVNLSKGAAL